MLSAGLYFCVNTYQFISRAVRVDGVVTELVHRDHTFVLYPVVSYTDQEGKIHKFYSRSGSNPPSYHVGEKVRVLIDPTARDPSGTATIYGFFDLWGVTITTLILGAAFVLITLVTAFLEKRDDNEEELDNFLAQEMPPKVTGTGNSVRRRAHPTNPSHAGRRFGAYAGRVGVMLNLFMLCGTLLLASGLYVWSNTNKFVARAKHVDGVIVLMRHDVRSLKVYPVIRYMGPEGQAHMLYLNTTSNLANYYVGKKVDVLIDTAAPDYQKTAAMDDFFALWGLPTILMVMGVGFLLVSLGVKYMNGDDE